MAIRKVKCYKGYRAQMKQKEFKFKFTFPTVHAWKMAFISQGDEQDVVEYRYIKVIDIVQHFYDRNLFIGNPIILKDILQGLTRVALLSINLCLKV